MWMILLCGWFCHFKTDWLHRQSLNTQMCSFALSFWVYNPFAGLRKHFTTGKSYLEETWSPYSGLAKCFTARVVSSRVALVLFRSMVVAQVASIANCIPWTLGTVSTWIIIAGNLHTLQANEMCWLFGIRNLGRKAFEGWSWWGLASYSMLRRHQCDMIQETQGLPLSFLQEEETARATSVTKTASADEFLTEAQEHGVTWFMLSRFCWKR